MSKMWCCKSLKTYFEKSLTFTSVRPLRMSSSCLVAVFCSNHRGCLLCRRGLLREPSCREQLDTSGRIKLICGAIAAERSLQVLPETWQLVLFYHRCHVPTKGIVDLSSLSSKLKRWRQDRGGKKFALNRLTSLTFIDPLGFSACKLT